MSPATNQVELVATLEQGAGVKVGAGQIGVQQGDAADTVVLLHAGLVELVRVDSLAFRRRPGLRQAGDVIGAAAAMLGRPYDCSIETVTACELNRLPAARVTQSSDGRIALWIAQCIAAAYRSQVEFNAMRGVRDSTRRLFQLVETCPGFSLQSTGPVQVYRPLVSHGLIARCLGVTPQHFSRLVSQNGTTGSDSQRVGYAA